jgi:predicted RNA-binding protein with PUA-like domain
MGGYWLVKSEPGTYAWSRLVADERTTWDGVRNFEARNNLRAMKKGDSLLFYHSGDDKAVVGIARVARQAYQDPTTKDDWSVVDVEPVSALARPVTLAEMRASPKLAKMALLRKSRLSVVPLTKNEHDVIVAMSKKG